MPAKILKIVLLLFIGYNFLPAQTHISAKSEVSGKWTVAGSPYIVEGEATIPPDSLLTIEAGVEVRFKTGTNYDYLSPAFDLGFLRIKGQLSAQGSAAAPVVFTRNGSEGNWGVLFFDAAPDSVSLLKYCRIEHASKVLRATGWMEYSGALSVLETFLYIENCSFSNNLADGMLCDNSSPQVINCLLAGNEANGILCSVDSSPQIINCTISGNLLYAVNSGYNSALTVQNSILWNNGHSFSEHVSSSPQISYSLIEEESLPAGVQNLGFNIFQGNPGFVDAEKQDFNLISNSICINSGCPDSSGLNLPDYDLYGGARLVHERIDIGAAEFSENFLRLITPNGLESWNIGTTQQIRWAGSVDQIDLDYSTDAGNTWSEIASGRTNNGFYDWLIPADSSEKCLIKISETGYSALNDVSDTTFIISDKTIISHGSQVYGTWSKDYSPYLIRGLATVPADSLLTIEPGVEVRFASGIQHDFQSPDFDLGLLKVDGRLLAEGAPNDSILFTRADKSGKWGMIFFNQCTGDTGAVKFARIEYASQCDNLLDTLDFSGALSVYSAQVNICDTRIINNSASGVHCAGSTSARLLRNKLSANGAHGLLFTDGNNKAQPLIENNLINGNGYDGIFINGTFYATIKQNRIEANGRYGVNNFTGFGQTKVINNMISANQEGLHVQSYIEITGNLISANSIGLSLDHLSPQIMNNTIVNNSLAGVYCAESAPYVTNCIFSGNGKDFDFLSGDASNPTASYSLFQKSFLSGKVSNGGANLLGRNPGFVSSGEHPFSLSGQSPAIDAGTSDNPLVTLPAQDMAGKPRIYDGDNNGSSLIDMGGYEFSSLIADFAADVRIGEPPLTVHFTDKSIGEIDRRVWHFGDGDSSTAENPVHIYQNYGSLSVRLTLSGVLGSVEKTEPDFIILEHAPQIVQAQADTSFYEDCGRKFVLLFSALFFDADSADTLFYSAKCSNEAIRIYTEGDSLFLNPARDFFGQGSIILSATDKFGLQAGDTFQVMIKPLNDAPVIAPAFPDTLRFPPDSSAVLAIWPYVSDLESPDSSLVYSFSTGSDSLSYKYTDSSGVLELFARDGFSGHAKLFVQVCDDSAVCAWDSVNVIVETAVGLADENPGMILKRFALAQNYPNPFNSSTLIGFNIRQSARQKTPLKVELTVYNILGQKVLELVNGRRKPGKYSVSFNAGGLPSGVYYYRLKSGLFVQTKKMILMR